MELTRMTVAALKAMKMGEAKVFEFASYSEYYSCATLCYRIGKIEGCRFSIKNNKDGTMTVVRKERK